MLLQTKRLIILLLVIILSGSTSLAAGADAPPPVPGNKKFTGDYDKMVKSRFVRVLVPYSKTFYFLDGAKAMGITHDLLKEFEKEINKERQKSHLKIHVVIIPTARDRLLPDLVAGLGDLAVGNLTITEQRQKLVDFSDPILTNVDELIITAPKGPKLTSFADLAGKEIQVRKSSSYYESLLKLNERFKKSDIKPITITAADENLEDEDLFEMLNSGLIPMMAMDSHKANFWSQIFRKATVHANIKINRGGNIGWAMRKNSPQLKKVVNNFVNKNKKGTLMGNMLFKRYLQNTAYVKNSLDEGELKRFEQTVALFQKYAKEYDFDWLMLAALSYQESGIDQSKKSSAGAIGAMQLLPSTAKDKNVNIPDISKIEANIHAGTKYLRFMMDRYFDDEKIDKLNRGLLAFASYNAGPAKVAKLRKEAESMGLDPNMWFRNVEVVAAKRIGRETVQYVSNIYKYYIAYKLIAKRQGK
ncbi:MAG: lytic transglycosylase F [Deltaproteobacteria bacterium]|nr:lytic transglycosylase F [Deltaproteobacteria bacterium]